MSDMWNQSFRKHLHQNSNCTGDLQWDTYKEEQRGFVWRVCLSCDKCQFVSDKYKLYTEIPSTKRGPKAAAINYGMQVGLSQVSMGSAGLRKIFLSGNIPAPSTKGMQNSANKVSEKLEMTNKTDMRKIRQELKEVNKMRGHPMNEIDVEGDACYNNPIFSGVNKTPFQPATQSCYVLVENMTDKKLVVNLITKNKLCSHGKDHSGENINRKNCKCTQNLQMVENIGNEEESAKEGLKTLYAEGFEIRHITTDPDTSAYRAADDLAYENKSEISPQHLIDTRHFSENQRRHIKKNENILKIMPGATKGVKDKLHSRFATDLSQRCHAEYESALSKCNGDYFRFKRSISHAVDAVVLCYQGNHFLCRTQSFVCKGQLKNNWMKNSRYLESNFKLKLSIKEQSEVRKCVNYRLGPKELDKTKLGTNSQKSECVNKIIRRSLPNRVTFRKNFAGRANSAVHAANHGPGESIMALCLSLGSPVSTGSKVHKSLQQEQNLYEKNKEYQKSDKRKEKRKQKTDEVYELYSKQQEEVKYSKGMLLEQKKFNEKHVKGAKSDHDAYAKTCRSGRK